MLYRGDGGFTLIEMLIGLTLVSLLLTISIPLVSGDRDDARALAAARLLASDLRWLRQEAIARSRETALRVDLETKRYVREVDGVQRALPASYGLAFATVAPRDPAEPARIRFKADGTSTGGRLDLTRGNRRYGVEVSWPLGRIRVRE